MIGRTVLYNDYSGKPCAALVVGVCDPTPGHEALALVVWPPFSASTIYMPWVLPNRSSDEDRATPNTWRPVP